MALAFISTWQCIQKLQHYADLEVRSWNPFKLFRKRRQTNHALAGELAKILMQERLGDSELLQIAKAIDGFEDSKLQYDLVCFLYCQINESSNPFAAKRKNIIEINQILEHLINPKKISSNLR